MMRSAASLAPGSSLGIAQAAELGIEKVAGERGLVDAAADQQLGHDGRHPGRALQGHDARRVVRMNSPVLGHVVLDGSRECRNDAPARFRRSPACEVHADGTTRATELAKRGYFFFSVCSVCLRSRGLYLLSLSFSPPVLRRSV